LFKPLNRRDLLIDYVDDEDIRLLRSLDDLKEDLKRTEKEERSMDFSKDNSNMIDLCGSIKTRLPSDLQMDKNKDPDIIILIILFRCIYSHFFSILEENEVYSMEYEEILDHIGKKSIDNFSYFYERYIESRKNKFPETLPNFFTNLLGEIGVYSVKGYKRDSSSSIFIDDIIEFSVTIRSERDIISLLLFFSRITDWISDRNDSNRTILDQCSLYEVSPYEIFSSYNTIAIFIGILKSSIKIKDCKKAETLRNNFDNLRDLIEDYTFNSKESMEINKIYKIIMD
jgi:hypothetical protein